MECQTAQLQWLKELRRMGPIRLGIGATACRRILLGGVVANVRSCFILNSLMLEALLSSLEDIVVGFGFGHIARGVILIIQQLV